MLKNLRCPRSKFKSYVPYKLIERNYTFIEIALEGYIQHMDIREGLSTSSYRVQGNFIPGLAFGPGFKEWLVYVRKDIADKDHEQCKETC